jgi:ribosomal protein S21
MTEAEKEIERVIQEIKYLRQMKKKRLYESARRAQKAKTEIVAASKDENVS